MTLAKAIGTLFCLLLLASHLLSISRWSEDREVNDDLCYLRQAHLFQRFGLGGFDTSMARDDDGYLVGKKRHLPLYASSEYAPCHVFIPATGRYVLQYPPGTGFVLAMFPEGYQVIPLFGLSTIAIFLMAVASIWSTKSRIECAGVTVFGLIAIYLMINPTKASYSMAPTMVVCAVVGWLTARFFADKGRHNLALTAGIGLLLGLSVNLRLANVILSAGYCLYFLGVFVARPNRSHFVQGLCFGFAVVVGLIPTLVSNAINAGSPFSTTYGPGDTVPPEISLEVLTAYLADMQQFPLLLTAVLWCLLLWWNGRRDVAALLAANLFVNVLFFATHPVHTQYYLMPIIALSLWTELAVGPVRSVSTAAIAVPAGLRSA